MLELLVSNNDKDAYPAFVDPGERHAEGYVKPYFTLETVRRIAENTQAAVAEFGYGAIDTVPLAPRRRRAATRWGHPTMSTPDLNAGDLPRLATTRRRPRSVTQETVRELLGHDGQFFTVPDSFPGALPDHITFAAVVYYAVVRTTGPDTGEAEFTVYDVDGRRRPLGAAAPDRDTAIRGALSALAERRRAHARQVEHNRVHVLGLEPVPPVRIGYTDTGTCIVHVRCSCPKVDGLAAYYEHVSLAADGWLDEIPTTPWEFCPTSPTQVTTESGSGRLTSTLRNDKGMAVVRLQHTNGRREEIALAQVSDLS
ncbi:hypothetical protein [Streptomyces sp. 7N604]|uniref:hypothetical protein n=1 Tax=Streptomyces sp. 7N604 TaxID=3457415 RepID=UPI003FD4C59A